MDPVNKMNLNVLLSSMAAQSQQEQQPTASSAGQSLGLTGLDALGGLGLPQAAGVVPAPGSATTTTTTTAAAAAGQQTLLSALGLQQGGALGPQQQQLLSQVAALAGTASSAQPFFGLSHPHQGLAGTKRPREDDQGAVQAAGPAASSRSRRSTQQAGASGRRRSSQQLEVLESVFKLCPNPNESRRKQLGQMLNMDERQVVIWFQNKRQRVRAKMKEQENNTLKLQHSKLKAELQREKARERILEQENEMLRKWMEETSRKMEELKKTSSELFGKYYENEKKDGGGMPAGLADALKMLGPSERQQDEVKVHMEDEAGTGSGGGAKAEGEGEGTLRESPSPKTPLKVPAGAEQRDPPKEEPAAPCKQV